MFAAHPDTLKHFPQFGGLHQPEDQRSSEAFQEHSETLKLCQSIAQLGMAWRFYSGCQNHLFERLENGRRTVDFFLVAVRRAKP